MAAEFPPPGSRLERYARVFSCVEINSTFYRSHRTLTYERWAASVPDGFRFSLKVPKEITHVRRLVDCETQLASFLEETAHLGRKRGVLLVQLPPKLAFDPDVAARFFQRFRSSYAGPLACEPRHPSWFAPEAEALLASLLIARVAADPAPVPEARAPGGGALTYYRWHGSPRMYFSSYGPKTLSELAAQLARRYGEVWCIFDNTTLGAATENAMTLRELCTRGTGSGKLKSVRP